MEASFRLPDTPPAGHTFPALPGARDMPSPTESTRPAGTRSRKPSLSIETRELASPPPQRPYPPPPPRTHPTATKPRSNSQPHAALANTSRLPAPPARKRDSTGTLPQTTPVHRSMFPKYNPADTGNNSATNSRNASPLPTPDFRTTYTQSIYSNARSPPMGQGSLSQAFAASTEQITQNLPSYRESMYGVPVVLQSNPNDVLDLWLLANGQDDQELALSYNLGLDCTDLCPDNELLCLTSTAGAVYTLRATNASVNITRTHPLNGASTMSIAAPTLYVPSESSQLVTTIFPVLSKIRAIDQAASLALSHALNRSQGLQLERESITRAHASTAAPLLYDEHTKSYCLSLPASSASSDAPSEAPPHHTLPIEINPGVSIRILEPPSAQSASNPILTLSLPAKTLIVHSHSLAALPSPYGADILISAMLVLILHLQRQNKLLSEDGTTVPFESAPAFAPPPRVGDRGRGSRSSSRNRTRDRSSSRSRIGSLLHPNRHSAAPTTNPSSSLAANARAMSRLSTHSAAATTLHGSPPMLQPSTPGLEKGVDAQLSERGTAPELNGAVTGLDLSRFQAYDLQDPRLGGGTRCMLRLLYWTFGVLVWVLGVAIGILAEVIVLVGQCGVRGKK